MTERDFTPELNEAFQELIEHQKVVKEKGWSFKIRNYQRALNAIVIWDDDIRSIDEFKECLLNEGFKNPASMMKKAETVFNDERLPLAFPEPRDDLNDEETKIINVFQSIPWVGEKGAQKLYDQGYRTIDDVREAVENVPKVLNSNQKAGVKYYNDLIDPNTLQERRIKRKYIRKFHKYLNQILDPYKKDDHRFRYQIAGSYRRKTKDSGDIDILMNRQYLKPAVNGLRTLGFDVITLTFGEKKYMGIVKMPGSKKYMRLDLMYTPIEEYPFAIYYFTGNAEYNQYVRNQALKQGFTLNEHRIKWKNGMEVTEEDILERCGKHVIETEKDIVNFLGLNYLKPEDRNY